MRQTATLAPAAVCPPLASAGTAPTPSFVNPNGGYQRIEEQDLLDYLNRYGADALYTSYQSNGRKGWNVSVEAYQDFTHDGVPEIAVASLLDSFYIFGCQDGQYKTIYRLGPLGYWPPASIAKIQDLNHNDIPEIMMFSSITLYSAGYSMIEWNGRRFQYILIPPDFTDKFNENVDYQDGIEVTFLFNGDIDTEDIDRDGWQEYVVKVGTPTKERYYFLIPWRQEKQYYHWNGKAYYYYRSVFSPPEYRFQAVQDGDRASIFGEYDQAQEFYQQAIFSDKLEWWSEKRWDFLREVYRDTEGGPGKRTTTPLRPQPDPVEYDKLAAYSRYRLMLLHAARGWVSDAKTVYDTLQQKYPEGKSGHVYANLAQVFWDEFSSTQKMDQACAKAIQFASEHSGAIFPPLGDNEHYGIGWIDYQNHPEMVCPFK